MRPPRTYHREGFPMRRDDSFRLITPEQADCIVFWGVIVFVAIGFAWGGY
jgi:hypothetical protein